MTAGQQTIETKNTLHKEVSLLAKSGDYTHDPAVGVVAMLQQQPAGMASGMTDDPGDDSPHGHLAVVNR
jgi:hypothetical protein